EAWGLCIAGLVDADRGTVRYAANLPLRETALLELLSAEAPPPRVFVNDLVAATVGEAAGETLALLQVGTGIAGRCAVEGRVAAWDPGTLRIGGGLAAAWGEPLLEAVRSALAERVLPDVAAATTVERARLGDAAALLGLAVLARSGT